MKFLDKINRNYLLILFVTLLIISAAGFVILKIIIKEEAHEKLIEKENLIKSQLRSSKTIPNIYPIIEIKEIELLIRVKPEFKSVYIENKSENNELEEYIEYSNEFKVNNTSYAIKLRQQIIENTDLLSAIALPIFFIILLVFILSYFINKKLTKTVWDKFEYNLNEIHNYSFSKPGKLDLLPTNILEFDTLNMKLENLTQKLSKDYLASKEFTENASHEFQTPLAIILMNLENILQEDLPEDISKKVYSAYLSATKLQKLNKNLLLLSKIENQQYTDHERVDLVEIIKSKISQFTPLIESKHIKLETIFNSNFNVNINPMLAEIMIGNLLSNAINHNHEKGFIEITANDHILKFLNSTKEKNLKNDEFFERFKKGDATSESVGLGLSIIKKITETYELKIFINQEDQVIMFKVIR